MGCALIYYRVGAGRPTDVGAVRGEGGAERGGACLWVVDGQEADDLDGVEGDAVCACPLGWIDGSGKGV